MKPDQVKKLKKNPKQDQWKRLLSEARRSRQLSYRKATAVNKVNEANQLKIIVNREVEQHDFTSDPTPDLNGQSDQATQLNLPKIDRELINLMNDRCIDRSHQTDVDQTRLNNPKLSRVIDEIQHQITAHVNSQPFYKEQELRRRMKQNEAEEHLCRICFVGSDEQLNRVCGCKGTMAFVHRTCLENWIKTNLSQNCNICNETYTGLKVTFEYHPFHRWLLKDRSTTKQILFFLVLFTCSFILHSKRALEFYSHEYRVYQQHVHSVGFEEYAVSWPSDPHRNREECVAGQSFRTTFLNRTKFTRIQRTFNGSRAMTFDGHNASNQAMNNVRKHRTFFNRPANEDQSERFVTSSVYTCYLLMYALNDLVQIIMYFVVCIMFLRYFDKEYSEWRFRNRIAIVKFHDDHQDLTTVDQQDARP